MAKCVCSKCSTEAECAANDWCLYDPYNKKCPNWLEGVKQHHRYEKQQKREDKFIHDLIW